MVTIFEAVILGVIQGLTEWLPISSSGHLAIIDNFFGYKPSTFFYVLLHVGTLFVAVTFLRKDVIHILKTVTKRDFRTNEARLLAFLVLGSIPIVVAGLVVELRFQRLYVSLFENMFFVGGALAVTGFLLFFSKRGRENTVFGYTDSILVGIAQAISLLPGVSRSGTTISTGLLRGAKREVAFKYSFLMSIPAILGAFSLSFIEVFTTAMSDPSLLDPLIGENLIFMVLGVVISMIVGYLSLKALWRVLAKGKFHWFGLYGWVAGTIIMISQIL